MNQNLLKRKIFEEQIIFFLNFLSYLSKFIKNYFLKTNQDPLGNI
jgi:hypothetical protein